MPTEAIEVALGLLGGSLAWAGVLHLMGLSVDLCIRTDGTSVTVHIEIAARRDGAPGTPPRDRP